MFKSEFYAQRGWLFDENRQDCENFIKESAAAKNLGPKQQEKYLTTIKFFDKFTKKVLRNLTVAELTDLKLALMASGYADNSKHDRLVVLRMFFQWIDGEDNVKRSRLLKPPNVHAPKIPEKELLTPEEVRALENATDNLREKAIIRFLAMAGATSGEFCKMKVEDANVVLTSKGFEVLQFNIPGSKNNYRPRKITVSSDREDIQLFRDYVRDYKRVEPGSPLWLSERLYPLYPASMYSLLEKLVMRTGLTKRHHPHWFRHGVFSKTFNKLDHLERCYSMGWSPNTKQAGRYGHAETEAQTEAFLERFPANSEAKPPEEQISEDLFNKLIEDDKVIAAMFDRAVEMGLIPKMAEWERLVKAKKR